MKQLAESIHPGDAALFILIRQMTADKVLDRIKDYGGVVLKTSLDDAKEQALRNALTSAAPAETAAPAAGARLNDVRAARGQGGGAALTGVLAGIPSSILSII